MNRIKTFIQQKPLLAAGILLFVGGVLALSFGWFRKLVQPAATAVNKATNSTPAA